jgi:hypothetical protein
MIEYSDDYGYYKLDTERLTLDICTFDDDDDTDYSSFFLYAYGRNQAVFQNRDDLIRLRGKSRMVFAKYLLDERFCKCGLAVEAEDGSGIYLVVQKSSKYPEKTIIRDVC